MPGRLPRRQKQNRKLSHRSITASLSWLTVVTFAAKAIPRVPPWTPWFQLSASFATFAAKAVPPCSSVDPVVPAFRVLSDLCDKSRSRVPPCPPWFQLFLASLVTSATNKPYVLTTRN